MTVVVVVVMVHGCGHHVDTVQVGARWPGCGSERECCTTAATGHTATPGPPPQCVPTLDHAPAPASLRLRCRVTASGLRPPTVHKVGDAALQQDEQTTAYPRQWKAQITPGIRAQPLHAVAHSPRLGTPWALLVANTGAGCSRILTLIASVEICASALPSPRKNVSVYCPLPVSDRQEQDRV